MMNRYVNKCVPDDYGCISGNDFFFNQQNNWIQQKFIFLLPRIHAERERERLIPLTPGDVAPKTVASSGFTKWNFDTRRPNCFWRPIHLVSPAHTVAAPTPTQAAKVCPQSLRNHLYCHYVNAKSCNESHNTTATTALQTAAVKLLLKLRPHYWLDQVHNAASVTPTIPPPPHSQSYLNHIHNAVKISPTLMLNLHPPHCKFVQVPDINVAQC